MEESFEKLSGVKEISGYSGGSTTNPTYNDVTFGDTVTWSRRNCIRQNNFLWRTFKKILVKFDPFDSFGQFCDKGYSYNRLHFIKINLRKFN